MSHPVPPPPVSRPTTPTPTPTHSPLSLHTTPSRVSTLPIKPKHHIPHRLHHHHHHHRDKSVPQSAVQPPSVNPFGDAISPITKTSSRSEYERESAAAQEKFRELKARETERRSAIWRKVEEKREGRRKGDETLLQNLLSLSTLSTITTRRLDYTYYSLLEHISTLSHLTSLLSDLASTSTALNSTFRSSTSQLLSSASGQLGACNVAFGAQATRIESLQHKLQDGRERVAALKGRLEVVRESVEGWERRESEWQGKVRRRVRMLWGVAGGLIGLFVILMVLRCWPRRQGQELKQTWNSTVPEKGEKMVSTRAVEERDAFGAWREPGGEKRRGSREGGDWIQTPEGHELEEDPRLRIFDEL